MRASVDLPTRIGPSIAIDRGGSNAGAGCGADEEDRGMAGNYSRKNDNCTLGEISISSSICPVDSRTFPRSSAPSYLRKCHPAGSELSRATLNGRIPIVLQCLMCWTEHHLAPFSSEDNIYIGNRYETIHST